MKDIKLYEKVPPIKNNFQVKFFMQKSTTGIGLLPHWHEHIELLYFTKGRCECFCDGKHVSVNAGDLLVVNSTEIHTFTTDVPTEYCCLITYPSFFSDIDFSDVVIKNHIPSDSIVKECIEGIQGNVGSTLPGSDMLIKSYNYRLFAHLVRNYRDTSQRESKITADKLKHLDKVFTYIGKNYNEKITTSHLASMCFLSEGYFCRFFKKATGRTVADYVSQLRIEKAALLLKSTSSPISDIAETTGFEDANYFTRIFKKIMGISPSVYRQKHTHKN